MDRLDAEKPKVTPHFIRSIEAKELKKRSFGVRIADTMTAVFGSFAFLFLNATFFACWILVNVGAIPVIPAFDPFPFPLLTTMLSLEAIVLTLIVLMSQNRQSLISSLREEIDIQVNLISEREITKILQLLHEYLRLRGVDVDDPELHEMLSEVDTSYIERTLENELTNKKTSGRRSIKPIVTLTKELEKAAKPLRYAVKEVSKELSK
jgi:uncharacterized membrane protein